MTPDWRRLGPGLLAATLVWAVLVALAFVGLRHPRGVVDYLLPVLVIALAAYRLLYFANSKIAVNDEGLRYTNFLGQTSVYKRVDFGEVDLSARFGVFVNYKFTGRDGRVWFRVYGLTWASDEMEAVAHAMQAGSTPRTGQSRE